MSEPEVAADTVTEPTENVPAEATEEKVTEEERKSAEPPSSERHSAAKSHKSLSRKSSSIRNETPLTATEQDFINAKSFLLSTSTSSGDNLYDHLVRVLTRIFDERPQNAVDIFESLSHEEKKKKFRGEFSTVHNKYEKTTEVSLAEIQEKLFARPENDDEDPVPEDDVDSPLPNLMELAYFFEQGGIGLSREEMVRIWLAMKDLVDTHPLEHVRFWGKVFGVEQNYIIAEAEYRETEEPEEEEEGEEDEKDELAEKDEDGEEEEVEEDDTPKPDYKPPPDPPKEENRTGCNKKTYFVCNDPGKPWIKLPSVTPMQIQIGRQIKKFFTGRLDAPVISFPPFPGNEANYLRAQIARVSAATHISPLNFYTFDEDEETESDDGGRDNFMKNEEFEGVPVRELVDPSLANWVHHVQHILPQGRTKWWNPNQKGDDSFEDEDEEEEREDPDEPQPEIPLPLLTPLSEDVDVDGVPPWTAKLSSTLVPQHAVAIMRSNLWPGAYAFASDRKFENVYIGLGHKYSAENYSPPPPPAIKEEFMPGDDITEKDDPTPEEEAALRNAQEEAAEEEEAIEEGEEEDDDY